MKKALLIAIPLVLVIGGVVGSALMGFVNIPGLTPKKKPAVAPMYGEPKEEPQPVAASEPPPKAPAPPKKPPEEPSDPARGAKKVARIWNEVPTEKLAPIASKWRDDDLARVLANMDGDKTAALLAAIDPARAAKLSQAIQSAASKPAP